MVFPSGTRGQLRSSYTHHLIRREVQCLLKERTSKTKSTLKELEDSAVIRHTFSA